jgi:TPR repeat protein
MKYHIIITGVLLGLLNSGTVVIAAAQSSLSSTNTQQSAPLAKDTTYTKCSTLSHADSISLATTLGEKYFSGNQADMNVVKAKEYYKQASKDNSPGAMNRLGLIYWQATSSKRDFKEAFRLFEKAAALNYAPAMVNLANMYQTGDGIPQNFSKAFKLYKQAADLNNTNAIYNVGYFYYKGFGTRQSYPKAISYFSIGANQGNARCNYMLGSCYMHGYGFPQNLQKAQAFFAKALKGGDNQAVYATIYHVIDSAKYYPHLTIASLPNGMPRTKGTTNADSLAGRWTGKLYVYDWSHTIIEAVENTTLDLKANGNTLSGSWIKNGKEILQFTVIKDTTSWKVEKTSTDQNKKAFFRLNTLTCQINQRNDSVYLTGNLDRIEQENNEPLRPAYFVLYKENVPQGISTTDTTLMLNRINPDSMNSDLRVNFTVKKTDEITSQVQNKDNTLLFSTDPKNYQPGICSSDVYPTLPAGSYNLVAFDKQYTLSQTITKNQIQL